MSRARVPESLLAGAATAVVAWPLTTLFTPSTWVRPTLLVIAAVVAVGILTRLVTGSAVVVGFVEVVAVVLTTSWLNGQGHLWRGLPTPDMVLAFNNLLVDARLTVQNYAAPAPTGRGVILGIGLAIGLTAILVDHVAVMRRSPALAGLPLLTTFLISASNGGESLHPAYFLAAAGVWLLMLGRQGTATLRRWSTTVPLSTAGRVAGDDGDGTFGYAALGRTLAVGGLVAAVALPAVIPHLPTRYLIDGLGRSTNATGFSDGQIGIRTTVDLARSLANPSTAPVLTYTTNAPIATPLRVGVLSTYANGTWSPEQPDVRFAQRTTVPTPSELDPSVPRDTYRIAVDTSHVEAPQIAAPTPVVRGDLDQVEWGLDRGTSVVTVNRSASSYSFTYLALRPSEDELAKPREEPGLRSSADLTVDPASASLVRSIVASVVPANASRIDAARAIQRYLRNDGGFSYSLTLPDGVKGKSGRIEHPDPISLFLRTRVGYCVQFATAMVMMARESGIPARMAVGFLPGRLSQGTYTVRASDAHAWPELYFDGIGWLRFEPTPSSAQATVAPAYSLPPALPGDLNQPSATATGGTSTTGPSGIRNRYDLGTTTNTAAPARTGVAGWLSQPFGRRVGWLLVALAMGLLGALAVPLASRGRMRRRLRRAEDEAGRVEVEWQAMVERIGDLGVVPPRGSTPRQAGQYYHRAAYLEGEESQALRRVVDGVERSRYARPGTTVTDIRRDTAQVVKAVAGARRRRDRWRATLWPTDGLTEWRELRDRVSTATRMPWERLQAWWADRVG
jgi:transglutaminase-like putative cysteine protease